jgi:Zn-dependent M28 family amino/carboxypeptidase
MLKEVKKYNFPYTIIFALWNGEERMLLGSKYYADSARNINDSILGVVNLDMICWDDNNDNKCTINFTSNI